MKRKIFAAFAAAAMLSLGFGYAASKATVKTKTSSRAAVAALATKGGAVEVLTCDIGAPGPGGGTVFLENSNWQKDGWRYLEAYWSDETIGVKYSDGTKLASAVNAGKVSELKSAKKSDWYIPSESELNSVISVLGYPNGQLPPGRYFVSGGKKFVSFDYDVKTQKRTLNKLPARFSAITLRMPSKGLKGAALTRFQKDLDKRKLLEQKRQELNVGSIVFVRKITVAELSKGRPRLRFELGKRRSIREIRQAARQQSASDAVTEVTFVPNEDNVSRTDYSAIDEYVRNLNIPTSKPIEDAARQICQTARSDIEKARAIFSWLGYNINYDHDALKLSDDEQFTLGIRRADETYERRAGVCAGYAALFKKMADAVGLQEAKQLGGYSKGTSFKYGDEPGGFHAWNSVKVGNRTILLDATWGAANAQSGADAPVLKDSWFDCDPEIFALSHFPLERYVFPNGEVATAQNQDGSYTPVPEAQGLSKPISAEMYKVSPRLLPAIATMGIKGGATFDFIKGHSKSWCPFSVYANALNWFTNTGFKINRLELSNELVVGQKVKFNFDVPQGVKACLYFKGCKEGEFENQKDAEFTFEEPGRVEIVCSANGKSYSILNYDVVASRSAPQEQALKAAFSTY